MTLPGGESPRKIGGSRKEPRVALQMWDDDLCKGACVKEKEKVGEEGERERETGERERSEATCTYL